MMTIAKLFGKSPFAPLQRHMNKVARCASALRPLFTALDKGDLKKTSELAKEISHLEHEADLTKNDIRHQLPKSLFLPVDRSNFFEILSLQDKIADQAEDIAILTTLDDKPLELYTEFAEDFQKFREKNIDSVSLVHEVVQHLQELLESSFGGIAAEETRKMIENIAYQEHEADLMQHALLKRLFRKGDLLSHVSFSLWRSLLHEVAMLSNLSEKLANRIRTTLELR
ncbi:MAG: TIGR00153 family protein [Chlamydiota bacterium]